MLIHLVQGQDSVINVISFNIRYPNPNDGIHYWDNRKELVSSIIQFYDADIIGVQEAHRRQLDELTAALPEYDWFGVCRTDGSNDPVPDNEFSAILYRRDRLAILDGNTFWLSLTPDKVASVGWDAAFPRIVTWVKFKDKKTGDIWECRREMKVQNCFCKKLN